MKNRHSIVFRWAQANPFSRGKFVTDPAMFGRVFAQAVTSMGTVMAAGAVGTVLGGPEAGAIAAYTVAFAQESNEAYGSAYDKAKAKGYSDKQIDKLTNESGLFYGAGAAVFEVAVPFAVLRSFGLGNRIAKAAAGKYAARYLDEAVEAGGKGGLEVANKAWQKYVASNLSINERISVLARSWAGLKPTISASLAEAGTEASQYLLEQAIVEGKVDGTEINLPWLAEKIKTPEFNESLAGGLVGGGSFAIPGGARKALGRDGRQAARVVNEFGSKYGEGAKQILIDATLRSPELSDIDKQDFVSLVASQNTRNAVENIQEIVKAQAPEPTEEAQIGPEQEIAPEPAPTPAKEEIVEPEPTVEPEITGEPEGLISEPTGEPDFLAEQPTKGSLLKDIIDPEKTATARNVIQGSSAEQVLDHALRNINQFNQEFEKLSQEEKNTTLSLLGNAMEQLSPARPNLKDKEGNYDVDLLRQTLVALRKGNFKIGVIQEEKELGKTTLRRQLIQRTPAEIAEEVRKEAEPIPAEEVIAEPVKVPPKPTVTEPKNFSNINLFDVASEIYLLALLLLLPEELAKN
jgi:hypothetical protein